MKFTDNAILFVQGGTGGMGCIAFLREKFRPKGGPSGGDGGHGGHVKIVVNSQLITLQDITYKNKYRAENGANGQGKNRHGKNGKNIIIQVPPGTIVKNAETLQLLKDLTIHNQSLIIAKGGNGGFGNARFKTQTRTAPMIANDGQPGQALKIELELKVIADVGLVGFPNAGKSTFLSKVSNAKPKIADYPFTTLVPNLGIVKYGAFKSFVMADIPGLIKGAAKGKGLGSHFLKHVERTKVLVYLIDSESENIKKDINILKNELKKHNPSLIDRPSVLLLSKADLTTASRAQIGKISERISVIQISSLTGYNIDKAVFAISKLISACYDEDESAVDQ